MAFASSDFTMLNAVYICVVSHSTSDWTAWLQEHGMQASESSHSSPAWKRNASSGMTRRASWLELDHAASAEGLGQTALLGDEERGRPSDGNFPLDCATCSIPHLVLLAHSYDWYIVPGRGTMSQLNETLGFLPSVFARCQDPTVYMAQHHGIGMA